MKMKKNWEIKYYGNNKRLIIKRVRKWTVSIDLDGNDPYNLMVDDEWNSYYMNTAKAWDNFAPIPKTLVHWCENIGIKYLDKFLEDKYITVE